jgi:hypothetical protein
MTECVFSPDERLVVTGLSGPEVTGFLVLLDAATLEPVRQLAVGGLGEVSAPSGRLHAVGCAHVSTCHAVSLKPGFVKLAALSTVTIRMSMCMPGPLSLWALHHPASHAPAHCVGILLA